jgi:phosphoglycolate phosphatase
MNRMRHAIFDLDGTLVDSLPGIAWSIEEALAACGLPPMAVELRPLIGPPIRSILSAVSGLSGGSSLDRLEQAFRSSYDSDGWRRTVCYAGAQDLLWNLFTSDISLWMVTNKPAAATQKILRHLQLDGFFDEVVCRDSRQPAYGSKAEALTDLMVRHGLSRRECVLIGDTPEDSRAAAAAGMECVIVPHGYGPGRACGLPDWGAVKECISRSREVAEVGSYDRP